MQILIEVSCKAAGANKCECATRDEHHNNQGDETARKELILSYLPLVDLLAKRIARNTGIPLAQLIELEPTPPTPYRGKGGPRRPVSQGRPRTTRTRRAPDA